MTERYVEAFYIRDLKIEKPVVQGGMGVGISLSGLASAVANEGGIGVISSAFIGLLEDDFSTDFQAANKRALTNEIRKAKSATSGVIGLNVMAALTNYKEIMNIAVDEGVDILFIGAGLPTDVPNQIGMKKFNTSGVKIVPIVSSGLAAKIILRKWDRNFNMIPDAFVVEGPLAGGHLGFKKEDLDKDDFSLEKLIPQVLSEIKPFAEKYRREIPLIAGGGIYTGRDIYNVFKLGVKAVQMGTRFVATHECDATDEFKNEYIKCTKDNIVIIQSPVGLPGRAIKNRFLKEIEEGHAKKVTCPWVCLKSCDAKKAQYCIGKALANAKQGHLDDGFAFCGANAYRIDKIISVKELFAELEEDYQKAKRQ